MPRLTQSQSPRRSRLGLIAATSTFVLGGAFAASCGASLDDFENDPDPTVSVASGGKGSSLRELGFSITQLGRFGTPSYLAGRIPAAIRDGHDARALLAATLAGEFRLAPGTDFEIIGDKTDAQGYRFLKLRQLHQRVPVAGAEIVLQVAEDGSVLAALGQLVPELRMPMNPALTGDAAIQQALGRLSSGRGGTVHEQPALQVFTREDAQSVLTYRAVVEYQAQSGRRFETLYVAAQTGEVVAQHSRMYDGLSRSVYDMKNACLRTGSELPGTLLGNEGASITDVAGRAVYNNLGSTYWFYKHFLGRDSYDNAGALLKSSVHATFSTGFSCSGANAAWLDAPYNQMVYGDGDGSQFRALTSMDVTGHELTHAVTSRTSNLAYQNESGALNEAMSDIIGGAGAEAWLQAGGTAGGNPGSYTPNANTWKIGEEVAPSLPGGALRSMSNPTVDAYSKDYYPERITGTSDNGGVHGNSGIANLAFYLLTQGGSHPRGKTTVAVTGIGIDRALKVFYTANSTLMTSSTNFQGARNATAQAAQNIYGSCSNEWVNTQKAWDAVGVPGTWTPCGGGGDTTAPTVSLTSPSSGATLTGTVTLSANAADNVAVTTVEFYRGTALIGSKGSAPYSISWDTRGVPNGSYTLSAKAKDAAGNVGTTAAVTVTVNNSGGGGGGGDEKEPNNDFATANAVTTSGSTLKGTIDSSADKDFFKIDLAAGKTLTATMTPPAGADYDLYIYNSNKILIGISERGAGLVDQISVRNSGTSTFTRYIEVRHYSGASATNQYTLKLSW